MPAETRVTPDPKALAYLKALAYSMLLPRRRATYTLLMVPHGASGAPVGVRRAIRGACKGSWGGRGHGADGVPGGQQNEQQEIGSGSGEDNGGAAEEI